MRAWVAGLVVVAVASVARAVTTTEVPFLGVTHVTRVETSPRAVTMHIVKVDLTAPGVGFKLSPQSGTAELVRQTTVSYLNQEHAQVAINGMFFDPVSNAVPNVTVAGLAASNGNIYSTFDPQPATVGGALQNYAIVPYGPALNIAADNTVSIVHRDPAFADNRHTLENVAIYNAISGSGQIISNGAKSIPAYKDVTHPDGELTGNATYSNANSWYNLLRARSSIGYTQDGRTLVMMTVDQAAGSLGMSADEVADALLGYGVYNALNLDGGGSTSLALQNAVTGQGYLANSSADSVATLHTGRAVANSLAVFAQAVPEPGAGLTVLATMMVVGRRRR